MEKPKLQLVGQDGNVFNVLGQAIRSAKKAGWTKEKIDKFTAEATAGDYNHALKTCMDYFEVS